MVIITRGQEVAEAWSERVVEADVVILEGWIT